MVNSAGSNVFLLTVDVWNAVYVHSISVLCIIISISLLSDSNRVY